MKLQNKPLQVPSLETKLQMDYLEHNKPTIIPTPLDIYVFIDGLGRIIVGKSENRIALQCKRFGTKSNRKRSR